MLPTDGLSEGESMEILKRIHNRLEAMGDRRSAGHQSCASPTPHANEPKETLDCGCCLLPIRKGDLFLSMPCCGAVCHLVCMCRVANGHRTHVAHACSHCFMEFEPDFESTLKNMYRILDYYGRLRIA
jgi:hypothetical protein